MKVAILDFYKDYKEFIGVFIGIVLQILMHKDVKDINIKFIATVIFGSVFVALYIVPPTLLYLGIKEEVVQLSITSISSFISIAILTIIVNIVPKAIKNSILKTIGLKVDDKNDDK